MITILGSTGNLGTQLCKLIDQQEIDFIAVTRKPEKIIEKYKHAIVMQADLSEPDTLNEILKQTKILVFAYHSLMGKGKYDSKKIDMENTIQIIDKCKGTPVKKIIYISTSYDEEAAKQVAFLSFKIQVENYLKKQDIPYTILKCPAFMQMHIGELMGKSILKSNSANLLGNGTVKENYIDTQNVAEVVLACVENYDNKTIMVYGPDYLSRREIIDIFGKYLKKPVKINAISPGVLNFISKIIKPFHVGIYRLLQFAIYSDKHGETNSKSNLDEALGINFTSVDDYVKNYCNN